MLRLYLLHAVCFIASTAHTISLITCHVWLRTSVYARNNFRRTGNYRFLFHLRMFKRVTYAFFATMRRCIVGVTCKSIFARAQDLLSLKRLSIKPYIPIHIHDMTRAAVAALGSTKVGEVGLYHMHASSSIP